MRHKKTGDSIERPRCICACELVDKPAKNLAHFLEYFQSSEVTDTVVHAICVFAGAKYTLVAHDGQMLRNIALRRPNALDNVLNTDFALPQDRNNL